ncbi:Hsp20/alpha crystallin family protein [Candidatus Azambacteria bacterium]|nr:Hsp20/alpha crystallin family protein [Candidatus Azambacteria bacterium]
MNKKILFKTLIDDKNEIDSEFTSQEETVLKDNQEINEANGEEVIEEKPQKPPKYKIMEEDSGENLTKKLPEGQLTIDMYQTPTEIIIKTVVAGVSEKDLDISITSDTVEIRGQRESEEEVEEDNYYYRECFWGSFIRSVTLPIEVNADKASASFKNGILTIRLPKSERNKTKKIAIKLK